MLIFEVLKAILFGIVEGITEWLPVSSTGHMILLDEFISLNVSDDFFEMFEVVIQLGAILAVVVLFFGKLNPFAPSKSAEEKKGTWSLWFKVIVAIIPSGLIGILLDDWFNEHFYNYLVVAIALIVYGVAFIVIEKLKKPQGTIVDTTEKISYKDALMIGVFQTLAIIPGTSRSGSTILGAMLFGLSRTAAAEFSFFMAIPTMLGASAVKVLKFVLDGAAVSANEWIILAVGCAVAFAVSLAAIKYLMDYVKRHSFSAFGVYRIILGALVIGYFLVRG
ncbi:MAG: undecaprenyl-diphosphate phosphatase [Clostridia bacterium]|nr:undecaprenyl-diphosphate phosphatase [Clostridia bacterium]